MHGSFAASDSGNTSPCPERLLDNLARTFFGFTNHADAEAYAAANAEWADLFELAATEEATRADLHNVLPTEWHEPFNLLFTRYETFKADIASWRRSSTALAKWAWSRCINRVDRYVRYKELSGRAKGNCFADHELHYHHLVEHFNGHKLSHLLAPYSTSPNDTCKWIGFDFDFHETEKKACKDPETIKARNLQAALRVYDALRKLGFRPLLVNSNGNGGYHVWVFFAEPIPSDLAYHFGRWMVRNWDRWGFQDQPEFFPKQPFLGLSKTGEPALGNVLRLPGRHHTREYWTMAWNGTAWVSGESAIQLVLKCVGDDPALIPPKIKVNAAAQAAQRAKRIARRTATAQRFDAAGGTFDGHDLTGISTDLIRDALAHLGPEYRDAYNRDENWGKMGWIEVGLALSSLGEEGLALWDEWSQNSPKYREDDCKERWATFKGDRQSPITVASIFHWAAKEGWQGVKDRQRELMKPYLDAIAIRAAEAQKPEDLTRFLDDLATLSRYDTDRWLELKAKLKASVFPRGGIADLAKRVSMRVEKMLEGEAKVVQDEEEADSIRPRIVADYGDPELSGQFVLAETYRYLRRQAATGKTVLYRRDTTLVRVVRTRVSTYGNKKMVMNAIDTVDAAKLMSILDGLADYGEVVKSGVRYGGVPERTCKAVLADSSLSDRIIPPLDYMITSPRFAPDGKLILKRGYHRSYATLHSPPPHLLKLIGRIATVPTGGEVSEAVKFIFEWVGDFPFVDDAGRAYFMSFLLLPLVRMMINGPTPLHIFEAPTMGTGKSLLASLAAIPTLGIPTPITHMRADCDDSEWAKKITSKVMSGAPYFLIDNWVGELRSTALDAAITTPLTWEDRRMGSNDATSVMQAPVNCAWGITSNNTQLGGDAARRKVGIRLDAKIPEPFKRNPEQYKHSDILGWSMLPTNRAQLLRCCLIIVSSWVAKGKPSYSGLPLGTFESWSRVMGGILESAGVPGFNPSNEVITSGELIKWNQFVVYWYNQDTTATAGSRRSLSEVLHLLINYVGDDTERKALFIDILEGRSATMDARVKRLDRRLQQLKDNTFQIGEVRVQLKYERDTGRSLHLEKL